MVSSSALVSGCHPDYIAHITHLLSHLKQIKTCLFTQFIIYNIHVTFHYDVDVINLVGGCADKKHIFAILFIFVFGFYFVNFDMA